MSGGNIKVVVRCRPLNSRELTRGAKGLIRMDGDQTILDPPENTGTQSIRATEKRPMNFSFDKSYWSAGPRDEPNYASQHTLYEDLGVDLLDHSFEGFNTCIFAYGQTGSGKSYSMMGYGADKGIIPLTTSELFRRVEDRTATDKKLSYTVEVSYIEIYNEKVRDLLNPKNKGNLRVREHPSLGPYVEDLSRLVVENYAQMMTLMDEGNKARTVASTNMNETSSRSHAVFTVILTQKRHDAETNMTGEKVSKISLVDLAGSERQASTGATGTRLKEGANINKSLTTLGKVIAALAQASETVKGKKKKDDFVPYRDSVLTWLLKESLGGNSKTAMIAAISPADYEETLSTLRYADAAKRIKTHAVVNEDPNAKLIRELKEELDMLRTRVATGGIGDEASYDPSIPLEKQMVTFRTKEGEIRKVSKLELQDQLQASEKLMEGLNLTWEEKMAKTQAIHVEREKALEELGIMVDKDLVGVHAPQKHPSLVNLNEDPLMSECLVYQLKPGTTTAGGVDDVKAHIKLSGTNILPEHCIFTNEEGVVTVEAMPDARTFVNGKRVPPKAPIKLLNGFRVILGDFHVFRFNDPASVRAHRKKLRASSSMADLNGTSIDGSPGFRPDSPGRIDEMMDWSAARREVADIEKLGDHDLEKLFDDIVKVRTQRKRPESRVDLATELESRLMSTSQTEESLENPWAVAHGTTMTTNSLGTPVMIDTDRDPPAILDDRSETETELPSFRFDQKAADTALEQKHLTRQLRELAYELKRTRSQAAAVMAMETSTVETADWSARELRLVTMAVENWKRLRYYKVAVEILTGAASVREANVLAKKRGRDVSYNFLVVHGSLATAIAALDGQNGVIEFDDVSQPSAMGDGPHTVVKVIDKEANAVYTWDLQRFSSQLNKMKHVLSLESRPNYSRHFRLQGTFTDHPAPSFSYIGSAKAPLRLLAKKVSYSAIVPIQCPYTMEAIGSCRVSFKCSKPPTSGIATPDSQVWPITDYLVTGNKFGFTIVVDSVKGLSSADFDSVHAQVRLSSLVGPEIAAEDTFTCHPVDLTKSSVAHLSLRRSMSVIITPELISYLEDGYGTIEFFAQVREEYQSRLERFDFAREAPTSTSSESRQRPNAARLPMRRCETDFVGPENHDILANISVRELSSDGAYAPTEVVDDIFQLHQGVQRQIHLELTHTSGKALQWKQIVHTSASDIRVVDKNAVTKVSEPAVELRLGALDIQYNPDGMSTLSAHGPWDTAAHQCIHLDRRSKGEAYLLVRITWLIEFEAMDEPAVFQLDVPIRILSRDARRSSILAFFSSSRIFNSFTAIFAIHLAPPPAQTAGDLWRLDTSRKPVEGEEILEDSWRPRSLSLIGDIIRMRRTERALADVQSSNVVLELLGEISVDHETSDERRVDLLRKYVGLWQNEMECRVKVDITKRTEEEEAVAKKLRAMLPDLEPKLNPKVKLQHKTEHITKQGLLSLLREPQANEWEKLNFVLRRPYLHVHLSAGERETQVINLSKASVTPNPDVELLLGRRFAFTIFTSSNSYVIQAASQKDLNEWISVLSTTSEL